VVKYNRFYHTRDRLWGAWMHTQKKIHFFFILVLVGFLILVIESGSKCQDLDYPDSLIQKLDENNLAIGNLGLNSLSRVW
jgi:hypothetical protein